MINEQDKLDVQRRLSELEFTKVPENFSVAYKKGYYDCAEKKNHELRQLQELFTQQEIKLGDALKALSAKQLCPKCKGQGIVAKPPHIPGDILGWTSGDVSYRCNLCHGAKVI
jgi:hypothetical protein